MPDTQNLPPNDAPDQQQCCPSCGLTRRELYAEGHMGCARCYDEFGAEVQQALREIHGAVEHIGKAKASGH